MDLTLTPFSVLFLILFKLLVSASCVWAFIHSGWTGAVMAGMAWGIFEIAARSTIR